MATRKDPRTRDPNVVERVPKSHFIGSEAYDQGISHKNVNSDRALVPIVGRHPQAHLFELVDNNIVIDRDDGIAFRENQIIDYRTVHRKGRINSLILKVTELAYVDADGNVLPTGSPTGYVLRPEIPALQQPYNVSYNVEGNEQQMVAQNKLEAIGFQNPVQFLHPCGIPNIKLRFQHEIISRDIEPNINLLPKQHVHSGSYITSRVKKTSKRDSGNFYFGYHSMYDKTAPFKDAMESIKETSPMFDPIKYLANSVYLETENYVNDNFMSGIADLGYRNDRMAYNWTFTDEGRYPMSILFNGTREEQSCVSSNGKYPIKPGDFLHYEDVQPFFSTGSHTDVIQASHRLEIAFLPEDDSKVHAFNDITARDLFFLDENLEDVLVRQMSGSLSNDEGFKDPRFRDQSTGFIDYSGRQSDSIVYRNMFR